MPFNGFYAQSHISPISFTSPPVPYSIQLSPLAFEIPTQHLNQRNVYECASQIYSLLNSTRSAQEILLPLQQRNLQSVSGQAEVFLKIFEILEHKGIEERFSICFKEKLSKYFDILCQQFSSLNIKDYFINLGANPQLPADTPEYIRKKIQDARFSVTFAKPAILHLIKTYVPQSHNFRGRRDYIEKIYIIKVEELQNFLQKFPENHTAIIILEHPPIIRTEQSNQYRHVSLLLAQEKNSSFNFLVIESLAGMYTPLRQLQGRMPEVPQLQGVVDCIAHTIRKPSKISYFPLKRQNDIINCPSFMLHDLSWCFADEMFLYVAHVERSYPGKIIKAESPNSMARIQAIPTQPALLLVTQSVKFFQCLFPTLGLKSSSDSAKQEGLHSSMPEQFDPNFAYGIIKQDFFEKELRSSILPIAPQKYFNLKADMIFMDYAKKLLSDLLGPNISSLHTTVSCSTQGIRRLI